MIILVCGGRDLKDRDLVFGALDKLERERGPIIGMIHGRCTINGIFSGADMLADMWMCQTIAYRKLNEERWVKRYPANWSSHGKMAGPLRNARMLLNHSHEINGVVAFPGGRGTADMMRLAHAAKLPIWQPKKESLYGEEASGVQSSAEIDREQGRRLRGERWRDSGGVDPEGVTGR